MMMIDEFLQTTKRADNGCLVWTGKVGTHGYGYTYRMPGHVLAHRIAWFLFKGDPVPQHVHHECRNKLCVEIGHLVATTIHEHPVLEASEKEHCRKGHPWTPENTKIVKGHVKQCRACIRERERRYRKIHGAKWEAARRERDRAKVGV